MSINKQTQSTQTMPQTQMKRVLQDDRSISHRF